MGREWRSEMSEKRFGEALRDVLAVVQRDRTNVSLRAVATGMPEYSYQSISKMASGQRRATREAIEAVVRRLNALYDIDLQPDYFLEYRIYLALDEVEEAMFAGELTLDHLRMILRAGRKPPNNHGTQASS